ncbi:MAG: alpha/beta hydrolase [Novosphingobium sp.]
MSAPMRKLAALFLSILALAAQPAVGQTVVYQEVIEEVLEAPATGSERFVESHPEAMAAPERELPRGLAQFGPFRVLDATHAALVDATDTRSPAQFSAMLRAWPGIRTLEMIECPGTDDDRANLRVGVMIHDLGIATHVPDGGSVRSGAVELFLAGVRRTADSGAEFAVHSWADEFGLEPKDYAPNAPENKVYLDYYRRMGMNDAEARAFYAMTNSVPNADAKWLDSAEMARWVRLDAPAEPVDSKVAVN